MRVEAREQVHQLGDRQVRVQRGRLELHADTLLDLRWRRVRRRSRARAASPPSGSRQALEHLDRGGLAGAVRTKQAEDLATRRREADAVDGLDGAERLASVRDLDHGTVGRDGRPPCGRRGGCCRDECPPGRAARRRWLPRPRRSRRPRYRAMPRPAAPTAGACRASCLNSAASVLPGRCPRRRVGGALSHIRSEVPFCGITALHATRTGQPDLRRRTDLSVLRRNERGPSPAQAAGSRIAPAAVISSTARSPSPGRRSTARIPPASTVTG